MPGIIESCRNHFQTDNLYSVLRVKKTASESEVKKGYHKVSLKVHPDRVPDDEKDEATLKFQTLGKVYCILSDKEKRAIYDETGEVDEEDDAIPQDRDWTAYWRLLFRKVTTEDIKDFEKNYKGSKEELEDLQTAYTEFKGDMTEILNNVMCSTIEDEPRFTKIIKGWIKKKVVEDYPAFSKENKKSREKRKREADKEAAEAEELKEELGLKIDDSLKSMIQKRQQSRESEMGNFFDHLEAKYAQPKKAKTSTEALSSGEQVGSQQDDQFLNAWEKVSKPRKEVERISVERHHELHSSNNTSAGVAMKLKRSMRAAGEPLRSGKWLAGEDKIVLENIKRYMEDYPAHNPIEMLHTKKNPDLRLVVKSTKFYSRLAEGLNRTIHDVFRRLTQILLPPKDQKKGQYTENESTQFEKLHKLYGPKWNKIGSKIGRSGRSLYTKWMHLQATKTGRWSESENALLLEAVETYRANNDCCDEGLHDLLPWAEISAAVPGRNTYQCRQHWLFKLRNQFLLGSSGGERLKWTWEKNSKIVELISKQKVDHEEDIDFGLIRKYFESENIFVPDEQISRQWGNMKMKVNNYIVKSFEEILDDLTEKFSYDESLMQNN